MIADTEENWKLLQEIVNHIEMCHVLGTYCNSSWLWTLTQNLEHQA